VARIARGAFGIVVAFVISGCAGAQKPPATPAKAETKSIAEIPPPDLVPSTRRDRRGEPGMRAAAKPLAIGKAKDAKCGKLPELGNDAAVHDVLGGRMKTSLPKSARDVAGPADGPTVEEESRVVVEAGGIAMAMMARETFQLDPDLYEPEADAPSRPESLDVEAAKFLKATFPEPDGLDVTPVTLGTSGAEMRAYAARPKHPMAAPGKDTALVLALLVARDDGTLQTISFHVRDVHGEHVRNAMGEALVGCTRYAERIASTTVKGDRELAREPGPRKIASANGQGDLVLRVPRDYVTVATPNGARLYKLRPLSLYAGSITIALADDPAKKTPPADADRTVDGKLLGRGTQWRGKNNPKGGGFLFAAESIDDKRFAGVLLKATRQAKVLDEMRSVAETLTLVPASK
jgi:hypothetical protein